MRDVRQCPRVGEVVGAGSGATLCTKGSAVASATPAEPLLFLALPHCTAVPGALRGANLVTQLRVGGFVRYLVCSAGLGVSAHVCVPLQTASASGSSTGSGAEELRYRRVLPELVSSADTAQRCRGSCTKMVIYNFKCVPWLVYGMAPWCRF